MIETLPDPPHAVETTDDGCAAACNELTGKLTSYLRDQYTVAASRMFVMDDDIGWVVVEKLAGNQLEQHESGKRQRYEWHRPGYDLVAVWKLGLLKPRYVAAAMTYEPQPDGKRIVGYYELRKR